MNLKKKENPFILIIITKSILKIKINNLLYIHTILKIIYFQFL